MTEQEIRERLFAMQDEAYAAFQKKLIPTVASESFIGVRTPDLRRLAKEMLKQNAEKDFLRSLPHAYFDENQLHAFLISEEKDFSRCIKQIEMFLPYVDNWATCDQMSPKAFKKHHTELLPYIQKWLRSDHPYTIRFAIGMLMQHFLDGDFDPAYLEWVSGVQSEEYYVRMMAAWYFATALAKQYDAALPYIEQQKLPAWTHRKALQKAMESYRITPEQKAQLRKCFI